MSRHAHECAGTADHDGPCRCACGAVVEAVVGAPYRWVWQEPNGSTSPFPGASWKPSFEEAQLHAGTIR